MYAVTVNVSFTFYNKSRTNNFQIETVHKFPTRYMVLFYQLQGRGNKES